LKKLLSILVLLALVGVAARFDIDLDALSTASHGSGTETDSGSVPAPLKAEAPGAAGVISTGAIAEAFAAGVSDRVLVDGGRVIKVLPPDNDGKPHQRFIVEIQPQLTVLVAHNLTLAPRIPNLRTGDRIRFKGEYEFSGKGGVVHWTHQDPKGWHEGGWIEHRGERYE
jgi:hypothetical protein